MTSPLADDMSQYDDTWELINYYLKQWGLESLAGKAKDMLIEGDSIEVVTLKLAETNEYKTRFKANEARKKKGLRVLSPAEYIEVERGYRDIMRRNGMPEGFYDSLDDYTRWIENDVSVNELADRAEEAQARYLQAAPEMREQVQRFMGQYGITPGQIVASLLDPDKMWPDIQRTINAASIAAEASRSFRDVNRLSIDRADELARQGVDAQDARRAFGELAGRQDRDTFLAGLAGRQLTARDQEDELLLGDERAGQVRRRSQEAERARFSGNYLATDRGQGLSRNTGGSY